MVHLTVTGLQLRRRSPASRLPPKGSFPELGVSSATSEFLTLSEDDAPESRKPMTALAPLPNLNFFFFFFFFFGNAGEIFKKTPGGIEGCLTRVVSDSYRLKPLRWPNFEPYRGASVPKNQSLRTETPPALHGHRSILKSTAWTTPGDVPTYLGHS